MPDISTYTDYRQFLKDYYEEVKAKNPGFSYQVFADKAGLGSKGFLFNVISGKRTLSRTNILGLIQAMKLDKYEADYFENLVAFNQAKNLKERNFFYDRLTAVKANGKSAWKPQTVRGDQFEYYSKLHYSVIRSLIDLQGFDGDYEALARSVRPRITAKQARNAIELLERLGFIKKQKRGDYKIADKTIVTEPEVVSLAVLNFHKQAAELALKAIEELPKEHRNVSGVTLGISKPMYERMCEEIEAFRNRLLQMAEADEAADSVYHLNLQLFPVSTPPILRKKS